jgi:PTH1 family peptidyl-tRNA hydrolase
MLRVGQARHEAADNADEGNVERFVVGLGNPGAEYERTRHNVGFMVLDALAREALEVWGTWSSPRSHGKARTCRADIAGCRTILVEPLTYMNRSGDILPELLEKYGCAAKDVVVLLDDLSLPLGRLRVRERGSAGGHHGLESILDALDTDDVVRMRLGIGEEDMPKDKADYVLSGFPPEKQAELDDMIARAGSAVRSILSDGVAKTMAIFNGRCL